MRIRPKRVTCRFNAHGGDVGGHCHREKWLSAVYPARGGVSASGRALPSAGDNPCQWGSSQVPHCRSRCYTGVRAYWLDLNFGKKPVKVTKRKTNTARKSLRKSSRPEGDYMEGAEGNVYVLRKTHQRTKRQPGAQLRQNGYNFQKGAAQFSITWRAPADLYLVCI